MRVLYIPSKSHTLDARSPGLNYKPYEKSLKVKKKKKLKSKKKKLLKISYVVRGTDLRDVRGTNYRKTAQIYSCCLFLFPTREEFVSIFLVKLSTFFFFFGEAVWRNIGALGVVVVVAAASYKTWRALRSMRITRANKGDERIGGRDANWNENKQRFIARGS